MGGVDTKKAPDGVSEFFLLIDADGMCRTIDGVAPKADDRAIWRRVGDDFVAVLDSSIKRPAADAIARPAPARLPSAYLAELRDHGFTVLDGLLDADAIARLKRGLIESSRFISRKRSNPMDVSASGMASCGARTSPVHSRTRSPCGCSNPIWRPNLFTSVTHRASRRCGRRANSPGPIPTKDGTATTPTIPVFSQATIGRRIRPSGCSSTSASMRSVPTTPQPSTCRCRTGSGIGHRVNSISVEHEWARGSIVTSGR